MDMFCSRLKYLRLENNFSQRKLAQEFQTSNSSICDWECGRSEPCFEMLIKIAYFFNVSTDFLLGLEDETGVKTKSSNSFSSFNNF